ncbi:MAG TPA: FHA domain-containing protein [Armatimonadota bacterium]|jgi:pSer/pThr/pTyr-binding forkhead associated (FHA) protein
MPDLTQQTVALGTAPEGTQVLVPLVCPVCQTDNPIGEAWCVTCGFRLGDTAGEAPEAAEAEAGALVVVATGQRLSLREGRNEVGRDPQRLLVADPSVSRLHTVLTLGVGGSWIEDAGSTNGTFVSGSRLAPGLRQPLRDGQELRLGAAALKVELAEQFEGESSAEDALVVAPSDLVLRSEDGLELPVPEGTLGLGRRADNPLVIPDPFVSGHHALVSRQGIEVTVTDLGSTNGTFLRGERLAPQSPAPLSPGDAVTFGKTAFVLTRVSDEPPADAAEPSEEPEPPSE